MSVIDSGWQAAPTGQHRGRQDAKSHELHPSVPPTPAPSSANSTSHLLQMRCRHECALTILSKLKKKKKTQAVEVNFDIKVLIQDKEWVSKSAWLGDSSYQSDDKLYRIDDLADSRTSSGFNTLVTHKKKTNKAKC